MALVLLPFAAFLVLDARGANADGVRRAGSWRVRAPAVCSGRGTTSRDSDGHSPSAIRRHSIFPDMWRSSSRRPDRFVLFAPFALVWAAGLLRPGATSTARRVLLAGPLVVFYAFYGALADWSGGRSYGPRYLIPAMILLSPGAALLWDNSPKRHRALAGAIACAALLQLPGVLVDYSKVSVDWARAATRTAIEERNWHVASSPFVLNARAALDALPDNLAYLAGRHPPRVDTTSTADNRDFAQQLSFSLDFWWLYFFYLRAISARMALAIGGGLMIVAAVCARRTWIQ